jgi:hypothetical protein
MTTPNQTFNIQDAPTIRGGALKALGDGRVGGYLVAWGDPTDTDLEGDYFTPDTDFMFDRYPVKGHAIVLFEHAQDGTLKSRGLGEFVEAKKDDVGLWVEAVLNRADQYAAMLEEILKRKPGKLGWSSGSVPQFVVNEDGHIRRWPVVEGSITASPMQPEKTVIQPVKALNPASLEELIAEVGVQDNGAPTVPAALKSEALSPQEGSMATKNTSAIIEAVAAEFPEVTAEQLARLTAAIEASMAGDVGLVDDADPDMLSVDGPYDDLKATPVQKAAARIAIAAQKAVQAELNPAQRFSGYAQHARANANPYANGTKATAPTGPNRAQDNAAWGSNSPQNNGFNRVQVGENLKYAHLSATDMAYGAMLFAAKYNPNAKPNATLAETGLSEDYLRTMAHKASKHVESNPYGNDSKANYAIKAALPSWIKADELNATNIATQGAEWVGNYVGNDFWFTPSGNLIWDRMVSAGMRVRDLPDGYGTYQMFNEGTDPIVYSPPEANDLSSGQPEITIKQSPFGTGDATVTPGKMGARVIVTQELIEDSVITVLPQLQQQMRRVMSEHRDKLLINGDTVITANTNINLIDGTPGTGDARPYYLAANGLRKYALVTNASTQAVSAAGAVSLSWFRRARSLLRDVFRENNGDIVYLVNTLTHDAMLAFPELATWSERQQYATIESGVVENVYGSPIIATTRLPLTNVDGKVSATPANNIYGTIMAIYADAIVAVVKRDITVKSFEYIRSDATEFVVTTRAGIGFRDAQSVAIIHGIGNTTSVL